MKKLVVGILAHVDAGKTTLSESMLYLSGKIRKLGRVDKKDAYLDNYQLERERGITIFSKQAMLEIDNTKITLLDTPGHIDFSAEMERTLQVLDYAILVISASDGVEGHTQTLWRLLKMHKIPVFIFVNKMDQKGVSKAKVIKDLKENLSDRCIDFNQDRTEDFYDLLAICDDRLMEEYLEKGEMGQEEITRVISEGKIYPCFFGSALNLEGVENLMGGLIKYSREPSYHEEFGAKVYKISRDHKGERLTHMKITGGSIKVRDTLELDSGEEKVNQIRLYSGDKYKTASSLSAGSICAVTGLTNTSPGQGLGIEKKSDSPFIEPVLSYSIILPEGCEPRIMLAKLREIEEEIPELNIVWQEEHGEIQAQIMGQVQIEILQGLVKERFDTDIEFDQGNIVYKETISSTSYGVGHFEPLRHYAEVHLLMEPGKEGSGLIFESKCHDEMLDISWQNLILTHLKEKKHRGVLTGSEITDMKISLVAGKAHKSHTEGGDFREATYRAVRQGLMQAKSIVLEPYYDFKMEIPAEMVGRAMTDIENMKGSYEIAKSGEFEITLIGSAPLINMRNYHKEFIAYTKGYGRLDLNLKGYRKCHNQDEVVEKIGYNFEEDINNPTGSIFCKKGAGFSVSWDKVYDYMHLENYLKKHTKENIKSRNKNHISLQEVDQIINRNLNANKGQKSSWQKPKIVRRASSGPSTYYNEKKKIGKEFLLVDGYNIIFDWDNLNELAQDNIDAARMQLLDQLSNYKGIKQSEVIVVFDAYKVKGNKEEVYKYHNIHVVYTKEAQTADQYIEKFVFDNYEKYRITVATSDAMEQIIIRGKASNLLSARELENEVIRANKLIMKAYEANQISHKNYLLDALPRETREGIEEFLRKEKKDDR